jgi:hypothetical protein
MSRAPASSAPGKLDGTSIKPMPSEIDRARDVVDVLPSTGRAASASFSA